MSQIDRKKGALLAAAAATMFMAAPLVVNAAAEPMGHCVGANSCKGAKRL